MKPDWKNFLGNAGAVFDTTNTTVVNFGNPAHECNAAVPGNILCDLSHLGRLPQFRQEFEAQQPP